jgi:predicted SAM-dependent methyltransferase
MKRILRKILGQFNYKKLSLIYHIIQSSSYDVMENLLAPNLPAWNNLDKDQLIICNFCGTIFPRNGPDHSESLSCPNCDSIARERVVIQCLLLEISTQTGELHLFFNKTRELKRLNLLDCSPRRNVTKRSIFESSLGKYLASDFEMKSHQAEIKIDLTDSKDIASYKGAFDIVICAHVLEHIPDYRLALKNLNELLSPDGILILQVPVLEEHYTKVTWDEFHGDNTRVFHRFGFDLASDLKAVFNQVSIVVGLLDFQITSPEISVKKYKTIEDGNTPRIILGQDLISCFGLGNPDLCDAFIARKNSIS